MDCEQGSTDELRRAINRFEAAAARRRPRLTPAPVRRPRHRLVGWQRPTLVMVAAALLSSLGAVWLMLPERREPPTVQVSAAAEPGNTPPKPITSRPRAHRQKAWSNDAGRPVTAVGGTTTAAPRDELPLAPARTNPNRSVAAADETPVSDIRGVAVRGEHRQTPETRQRPIARAEPGTEPPRPEHGAGEVTATRAAEDTTLEALSVPSLMIPYRGVMTDASGAPLVGLVSAIFALYQEPSGGVPLWVDIKTVRADATGGYVVLLGGTTEFPADLFTTDLARWLGVQPDGEAETPRTKFTGGPGAQTASNTGRKDERPVPKLVRLGGRDGAGDTAAIWEATNMTRPALVQPPPLIPYRGVISDVGRTPGRSRQHHLRPLRGTHWRHPLVGRHQDGPCRRRRWVRRVARRDHRVSSGPLCHERGALVGSATKRRARTAARWVHPDAVYSGGDGDRPRGPAPSVGRSARWGTQRHGRSSARWAAAETRRSALNLQPTLISSHHCPVPGPPWRSGPRLGRRE